MLASGVRGVDVEPRQPQEYGKQGSLGFHVPALAMAVGRGSLVPLPAYLYCVLESA